MIGGVSLQEAAAVGGSASEQKLERGGETKMSNSGWECGPFTWIPV